MKKMICKQPIYMINDMKSLILILLLITPLLNYGQSYYSDARTSGGGFSYHVTLQITEAGYNSYQKIKTYEVKIISVQADHAKGYYDLSHAKYYSCSQLGSICNPENDYNRIYFDLKSNACSARGRNG